MKIVDIKAFPTSFPLPPNSGPRLGIGQAVKRDAVMVKVITEDGIVGWGESHHGRAHTAIAKLLETTLRQLVLGMDAFDTTGIWARIYKYQLASHGMGAGTAMAMSGLDMALWDAKGKALNLPLYKLLGGSARAVPAYAGGVALGYQPPAQLIDEAAPHMEAGYKAVKLRVGDTVRDDIARMEAVRDAFGHELEILTDANIGYNIAQVRQVLRDRHLLDQHLPLGVERMPFVTRLLADDLVAAQQRQKKTPRPGIGDAEAVLDRRIGPGELRQPLPHPLQGMSRRRLLPRGGGSGMESLDALQLVDQALLVAHGWRFRIAVRGRG